MKRLPGSGKLNPYSGKPWSWRPYHRSGQFKKSYQHLEFDSGWRFAYFVETMLTHTKGRWKGRPFLLTPAELEIGLMVFGTLDRDELRVIRTVWIEWARKNGKSEMAAAVALYLLYADGENAGEIYGAASKRDQAALVFNVAAAMVEASPVLNKRSRIFHPQKRIVVGDSFYWAIPADAAGSHGFNASGIVFDEVHTQPNRELWDALATSMGAREQPLTFAITTAGTDQKSLAADLHEYADKVQRGVVKDSSWYVDLRNTPKEADWRDEKVWYHANPHLGTRADIRKGSAFRSIEDMRKLAAEADHMPAQQTTFRNLYLNQWTQSMSQWIDLVKWDQGGREGTLWLDSELSKGGEMHDRKVYLGLDLAATQDVTSYVLLFPYDDYLRVVWRFFLPQAWVDKRPSHPLTQWAREGHIEITPGDIVDYDLIQQRIEADADAFTPIELGYDPWQSTMLVQKLTGQGITAAEVRQGPATLTAPTKELERLIGRGMLHHNNNPVARWMMDNCVVVQTGDQMRLSKDKAADKIDGIAALINAVERWMHAEPPSRLKAYFA